MTDGRPTSLRILSYQICSLLAFGWAWTGAGPAGGGEARAAESWELTRPAASFERHLLADETFLDKIKKTGNLAGTDTKDGWPRAAGWFEYDFAVPAAGWHEILVSPSGGNHEFRLDGEELYQAHSGEKLGNFWLKAGSHTLRIQRLHWTGLSPITGWRVRAAADADPARALRAAVEGHRTLLRLGEQLRLQVQGGAAPGQTAPFAAVFTLADRAGQAVSSARLELPAGQEPVTRLVALDCPGAGEYSVRCAVDGRELTAPDWPPVKVLVRDASPLVATGREPNRELLTEIDCATTEPDYFGGGPTRVVETAAGRYRESGDLGWLQFMNETDPSWFAYRLTVPEAQQPYQIEVDYPDDARRTFCLAVRENAPGAYPTTGGVDSGGESVFSQSRQTHVLLHWARGTELRLLCITPQTGSRAAVARIRLYRIRDGLPALRLAAGGGRSFGNWYEEGGSLMGVYGAPDKSLAGAATAAERWAQSLAYMGGDTLMYTMAVYQFGLYPSHYNVSFGTPFSPDVVGAIVLECERRGQRFVGEFHPEARELAWPRSPQELALPEGLPADNRSYSRDGQAGRLYSVLHPRNQAWYLGLIGEFVDRYKDSPAFAGVSLRLMNWANPGLNNFDSLEWGYDDYTIAQFSRDTGQTPPGEAGDPKRFRQRYDWLLANAREEWLNWRCAQITAWHRRLADRVRQARTDLKLYVNGGFEDLRGAGIDPAGLSQIPGLVLVGGCSYGRRGRGGNENLKLRDRLIDPTQLNCERAPGRPGAFLFGAGYFEATEVVVPPVALGYAADTKKTWISGVVNPAGRNYLERWSLALAEADAQFLADGGNAYTLGQPLLREFLAEYRCLPALSFTPRADARDPVAVWELKTPTDFFFYAVNRENHPLTVELTLDGEGEVRRLAPGSLPAVQAGRLRLELAPFQLLACCAPPSLSLGQVQVLTPPEKLDQAQRVVTWLEAAANRKELKSEERQRLEAAARTARAELEAGHVWRVRTLVEAESLQRIYQATLAYPPLAYPRPELAQLKAGGNYRAWAKQYPQTDLSQPVSLAATLRAGDAPGELAAVPEQSHWGLLATWKGEEAELKLPFAPGEPQKFRLWVRLAQGPGCAGLAVQAAGGKFQTLATDPQRPDLVVPPPLEIALRPGDKALKLRAEGAGQVYLDQVYCEPLFTPLAPLSFAAYFPNPGQASWEKALPPETAAPEANPGWPGTDGHSPKPVKWEPYPGEVLQHNHNLGVNRAWGQVRCPPGPLGPEVVAYCRAFITSPTARPARISFGATAQVRLWLNGELLVDSVRDKLELEWWRGPQVVAVKLRAGTNVLLAKLANAESKPNSEWYKLINFSGAISDPGDLQIASGLEPGGTADKR